MFVKCLASGSVVGGVIVLAAVSYGCQMGLKESEFGWMAGIVVAGLGVCAGLLVFLIFLIVGLVAKLAARQGNPSSGQAVALGPPDTKSDQDGSREEIACPSENGSTFSTVAWDCKGLSDEGADAGQGVADQRADRRESEST